MAIWTWASSVEPVIAPRRTQRLISAAIPSIVKMATHRRQSHSAHFNPVENRQESVAGPSRVWKKSANRFDQEVCSRLSPKNRVRRENSCLPQFFNKVSAAQPPRQPVSNGTAYRCDRNAAERPMNSERRRSRRYRVSSPTCRLVGFVRSNRFGRSYRRKPR